MRDLKFKIENNHDAGASSLSLLIDYEFDDIEIPDAYSKPEYENVVRTLEIYIFEYIITLKTNDTYNHIKSKIIERAIDNLLLDFYYDFELFPDNFLKTSKNNGLNYKSTDAEEWLFLR